MEIRKGASLDLGEGVGLDLWGGLSLKIGDRAGLAPMSGLSLDLRCRWLVEAGLDLWIELGVIFRSGIRGWGGLQSWGELRLDLRGCLRINGSLRWNASSWLIRPAAACPMK